MSKRLVPILGLVVVLLLVVGLAMARTRASAAGPVATPTQITLVQAATPQALPTSPAITTTLDVSSTVRATGILQSANQATLSFQQGGIVRSIGAKEGDDVKTGDVLISLDTGLLETQVAQAQAAFDLAQATLDKVKAGPTLDDIAIAKANLQTAQDALAQAQAAYDKAGGSSNPYITTLPQSLALQQAANAYQQAAAAFDQAVNHPTESELKIALAQAAQAQAALDFAKRNFANASLVAPFDGSVVKIIPKFGEMVSPGVPVVTVADLTHMQVQVNLDEVSLASIQVGQSVTLTLDALGDQALSGHVSKIGLFGSSVGGVVGVPVTIDVDPTTAHVYPGLSANVVFQGAGQ
ncbi:MAG: efflux RND transporter periplasmic adaptor subunit [Chloroflexi bacterium]|nr:efflux RND transporter periplasmic adaptor subunit [Chloroflexota bacterium]